MQIYGADFQYALFYSIEMNNYELKHEISLLKTNEQIRSFKNLSFQDSIESLNLSNNLFFDFIDFKPPNRLKALILNDNPIISFEGFPDGQTPNLEEISLINCPISRMRNFRSLCIIAVGTQLKSINGVKITHNDLSSALKYGTELANNDSKTIRQLLIHGWLPKKPVILEKSTLDSIWNSLESRKNDPFSLKTVSKLRIIGYDKSEIKDVLRKYFSPSSKSKFYKKNIPEKNESDPIESQVQKQQELINTLSVQIQSLRNGNKTFNAYDEMLKTIGAPLIKNAEIIINHDTIKTNSKTAGQSNLQNDDDYEELRKAAIDLIQEPETIDDYELIQKLSDIFFGNETDDLKDEYEVEENEEQ